MSESPASAEFGKDLPHDALVGIGQGVFGNTGTPAHRNLRIAEAHAAFAFPAGAEMQGVDPCGGQQPGVRRTDACLLYTSDAADE